MCFRCGLAVFLFAFPIGVVLLNRDHFPSWTIFQPLSLPTDYTSLDNIAFWIDSTAWSCLELLTRCLHEVVHYLPTVIGFCGTVRQFLPKFTITIETISTSLYDDRNCPIVRQLLCKILNELKWIMAEILIRCCSPFNRYCLWTVNKQIWHRSVIVISCVFLPCFAVHFVIAV